MPDAATSTHSRHHRLLSNTTRVNIIMLCVLLLISSGLLVTAFLTSIITMLAASLILTYILISPVNLIDARLQALKIAQRGLPASLCRALAIVLVYLVCIGTLVITVIRVAPALSMQIKEFAHDIPTYVSHITETTTTQVHVSPAGPLQTITTTSTHTSIKPQSAKLLAATYALALQKLTLNYKDYLSRLGSFILDLGATTLNGLIYALTTLVLVFYLLHDGKAIKNGIVDLMPARNEAAVARFLQQLHVQFHGIIQGQLVMSVISGSLLYILLTAMSVKYALLLGIVFGTASILPIIGPWLGLIPIIGIIAFSGHPIDILQVLLVTGLFYVTKTYWLSPKLLNHRFDIHPILFILTFVACLKLIGFLGLLLSFPLASFLSVALNALQASHRQRDTQTKLPLKLELGGTDT